MPTTQKVEIIGKKKFVPAALNEEDETFVVYMAAFNMVDSTIHPSWQAQISLLGVKKVTIPSEYADYTNVFSSNFAAELPEYTSINDHPIDLIDDK